MYGSSQAFQKLQITECLHVISRLTFLQEHVEVLQRGMFQELHNYREQTNTPRFLEVCSDILAFCPPTKHPEVSFTLLRQPECKKPQPWCQGTVPSMDLSEVMKPIRAKLRNFRAWRVNRKDYRGLAGKPWKHVKFGLGSAHRNVQRSNWKQLQNAPNSNNFRQKWHSTLSHL